VGVGFDHIWALWALIPPVWVVGYVVGSVIITVMLVAFALWRHV
jgi:hypothetical protein